MLQAQCGKGVGVAYALHLADVLIINQFPDVRADGKVGKRNLIVRLGPRRARWLYPLLVLAAALWLMVAVAAGRLPRLALSALLSLVPSAVATRNLLTSAEFPSKLDRAIRTTIAAALLHGALLAGALVAAKVVRF